MKTIIINESQTEKLINDILLEQNVTLSAENFMAKINGVLYKLKVWGGGLLGYQPIKILSLTKLSDGGARIKWEFDGIIGDQSGDDIIPPRDMQKVVNDLGMNGMAKWELKKSGKTVKLIKAVK